MLRDLAISMSFANLCYFKLWSEVLTSTRGDSYTMKAPPPPLYFMGLMFNVVALGAFLWILITLLRRHVSGRLLYSAKFIISVTSLLMLLGVLNRWSENSRFHIGTSRILIAGMV